MGVHSCTDSINRTTLPAAKMSTKRSTQLRFQPSRSVCDVQKSIETGSRDDGAVSYNEAFVRKQRYDIAKKVRFQATMQVCTTLHLNDRTDAELDASWYRPSEYDEIRSQIKLVLSTFDEVEQHLHPILCRQTTSKHSALRGLESHTRSGSIAKKLRRHEAIGAVLAEQDRQYGEYGEIQDCHRLANVYSEYTQISNRLARGLGIADEQETTIRGDGRWDPVHGPSPSKAPSMLYPPRHARTFPLKERQRESIAA